MRWLWTWHKFSHGVVSARCEPPVGVSCFIYDIRIYGLQSVIALTDFCFSSDLAFISAHQLSADLNTPQFPLLLLPPHYPSTLPLALKITIIRETETSKIETSNVIDNRSWRFWFFWIGYRDVAAGNPTKNSVNGNQNYVWVVNKYIH